MKIIDVECSRDYQVKIANGLLKQAGNELRPLWPKAKIAVVTDSNVAPLYFSKLEKALGENVPLYVFPAGEKEKKLSNFAEILEFLAREQITRDDLLIALGGGVTGDMAGFAAACYMRGIEYVQIPTTLLAAVDSSVGGKTAVDLKEGKNLAGAFYQPSLVLIDPECFATLPPQIYREGVAEAIKYGILYDKELFELLAGADFDDEISEVVQKCVRFKAKIVHEDENDRGERQMLNLGHSFAHAIEKCSDYSVGHGDAVSIGMCMAARASEKMGFAEPGTLARIAEALIANGLPVVCEYRAAALAKAALSDKKRSGDAISFILIERIGECTPLTLPLDELENIMRLGAGED